MWHTWRECEVNREIQPEKFKEGMFCNSMKYMEG